MLYKKDNKNLFSGVESRINPLTGEKILYFGGVPSNQDLDFTSLFSAVKQKAHHSVCEYCEDNLVFSNEIKRYNDNFSVYRKFSSAVSDEKSDYTDDIFIQKQENIEVFSVKYSSNHSYSLQDLSIDEITNLFEIILDILLTNKVKDEVNCFEIFESYDISQVHHPCISVLRYLSSSNILETESKKIKNYFEINRRTILLDYLTFERDFDKRIIFGNSEFSAIVPFWSSFPFEIIIMSNNSYSSLTEFNSYSFKKLSEAYKVLSWKYEKIFNTKFSYYFEIHIPPIDGLEHPEWHFHIHFRPTIAIDRLFKLFNLNIDEFNCLKLNIQPEFYAEILKSA